MMFPKLREIKEDIKAYRRGEKRIAPFGSTGRVYAPRKPSPSDGGPINSQTEPKLAISARIIRADGTVEDLGKVYTNG